MGLSQQKICRVGLLFGETKKKNTSGQGSNFKKDTPHVEFRTSTVPQTGKGQTPMPNLSQEDTPFFGLTSFLETVWRGEPKGNEGQSPGRLFETLSVQVANQTTNLRISYHSSEGDGNTTSCRTANQRKEPKTGHCWCPLGLLCFIKAGGFLRVLCSPTNGGGARKQNLQVR